MFNKTSYDGLTHKINLFADRVKVKHDNPLKELHDQLNRIPAGSDSVGQFYNSPAELQGKFDTILETHNYNYVNSLTGGALSKHPVTLREAREHQAKLLNDRLKAISQLQNTRIKNDYYRTEEKRESDIMKTITQYYINIISSMKNNDFSGNVLNNCRSIETELLNNGHDLTGDDVDKLTQYNISATVLAKNDAVGDYLEFKDRGTYNTIRSILFDISEVLKKIKNIVQGDLFTRKAQLAHIKSSKFYAQLNAATLEETQNEALEKMKLAIDSEKLKKIDEARFIKLSLEKEKNEMLIKSAEATLAEEEARKTAAAKKLQAQIKESQILGKTAEELEEIRKKAIEDDKNYNQEMAKLEGELKAATERAAGDEKTKENDPNELINNTISSIMTDFGSVLIYQRNAILSKMEDEAIKIDNIAMGNKKIMKDAKNETEREKATIIYNTYDKHYDNIVNYVSAKMATVEISDALNKNYEESNYDPRVLFEGLKASNLPIKLLTNMAVDNIKHFAEKGKNYDARYYIENYIIPYQPPETEAYYPISLKDAVKIIPMSAEVDFTDEAAPTPSTTITDLKYIDPATLFNRVDAAGKPSDSGNLLLIPEGKKSEFVELYNNNLNILDFLNKQSTDKLGLTPGELKDYKVQLASKNRQTVKNSMELKGIGNDKKATLSAANFSLPPILLKAFDNAKAAPKPAAAPAPIPTFEIAPGSMDGGPDPTPDLVPPATTSATALKTIDELRKETKEVMKRLPTTPVKPPVSTVISDETEKLAKQLREIADAKIKKDEETRKRIELAEAKKQKAEDAIKAKKEIIERYKEIRNNEDMTYDETRDGLNELLASINAINEDLEKNGIDYKITNTRIRKYLKSINEKIKKIERDEKLKKGEAEDKAEDEAEDKAEAEDEAEDEDEDEAEAEDEAEDEDEDEAEDDEEDKEDGEGEENPSYAFQLHFDALAVKKGLLPFAKFNKQSTKLGIDIPIMLQRNINGTQFNKWRTPTNKKYGDIVEIFSSADINELYAYLVEMDSDKLRDIYKDNGFTLTETGQVKAELVSKTAKLNKMIEEKLNYLNNDKGIKDFVTKGKQLDEFYKKSRKAELAEILVRLADGKDKPYKDQLEISDKAVDYYNEWMENLQRKGINTKRLGLKRAIIDTSGNIKGATVIDFLKCIAGQYSKEDIAEQITKKDFSRIDKETDRM